MSEPPHRQLALAAGSLLDVDPFRLVEIAAQAGFDAIGIRPAPDLLADARRLDELRRRIDDVGIRVNEVEVLRIGSSAAEPDPLIAAANVLGARAVLIVSDIRDVTETVDALGDLSDRCRDAGVIAALEYMGWTTPARPADAVEMARATGSIVVVDVLHHHRVGAAPGDLAAIVESGTFGWLQLCDGPAKAPEDLLHEARHDRLMPGGGELPLSELLDALDDDALISVEVQSDRLAADHAPDERARRLERAARSVLNRRR